MGHAEIALNVECRVLLSSHHDTRRRPSPISSRCRGNYDLPSNNPMLWLANSLIACLFISPINHPTDLHQFLHFMPLPYFSLSLSLSPPFCTNQQTFVSLPTILQWPLFHIINMITGRTTTGDRSSTTDRRGYASSVIMAKNSCSLISPS